MKRALLFGAWLLTISAGLMAQPYAVYVNGGQFGNPNSNVNVQLYDPVLDSNWVIDTIQTQSAQDILIQGDFAFVAAQDSIVRYDLSTQSRTHAAAFNGPSTYTLTLDGNILMVGNWYGKSADNLYLYDASNLSLLDSVNAVAYGAKSILVKNGFAFISQNQQNSTFQDTLGYVIRLDLSNLSITDTLKLNLANYTGDFGQLIERPDGNGFYILNSVSNTISSFDFASPFTSSNRSAGVDLKVTNTSQWATNGDTLYARMESGIGAINLNNLQVIDTSFIDTVVTAFAYDSVNALFYVTQTDFFSFTSGKSYDRAGSMINRFSVGFSPEAISFYYGNAVGIMENRQPIASLNLYPNPAAEVIYINEAKAGDLIRMIDLSGKLVMENRLSFEGEALDISTVNKGTYIVMLQSSDGMRTTKIIVE